MSSFDDRHSFPAVAVIVAAILAVGLLMLSSLDGDVNLQAFFGGGHPFLVAFVVALIGVTVLYLLQTRFGFLVWRGGGAGRFLVAGLCSLPFIAAITLMDIAFGFPADINVGLPTALAFYPAMGFFAQVSLHLLPFLAVLLVVSLFRPKQGAGAFVYVAILLASLPEAVFQIRVPIVQGEALTGLDMLLAAHLLAFGCVELWLYKRFDFVSMYAFRMAYYAHWHVLWEMFRA